MVLNTILLLYFSTIIHNWKIVTSVLHQWCEQDKKLIKYISNIPLSIRLFVFYDPAEHGQFWYHIISGLVQYYIIIIVIVISQSLKKKSNNLLGETHVIKVWMPYL